MNTPKPTSPHRRKKRPLTAKVLIRVMQEHPTATALILGLLFAGVAAYVAIDMAA